MSPKQITKRATGSLLLALGVLFSTVGAASAITLVGSDGRDEVSVQVASPTMLLITPAYVYVPPAVGKSDDASCSTTVDALTLRPIDVRCLIRDPYLLSVDLKGGDDQLRLEAPSAGRVGQIPPTSITVDGGAGADTIAVDAPTSRWALVLAWGG